MTSRKKRPTPFWAPRAITSCTSGTIASLLDSGQALVDFPGALEPVPARTVMPPGTALSPGDAVLLAFENADPALPIIIGQPRDLPEPDPQGDNPGTIRTPHDITMTVSSLHLDARQEIVLRCGEGSLTIRADGTVVLRGTRLLSRSSGSNKIQGASIRLN